MAAHLVEAACLVRVSVDAVLDTLRCIADKVVSLSLHGAHAPHLEHEPVHSLRLTSNVLQRSLNGSVARTNTLPTNGLLNEKVCESCSMKDIIHSRESH